METNAALLALTTRDVDAALGSFDCLRLRDCLLMEVLTTELGSAASDRTLNRGPSADLRAAFMKPKGATLRSLVGCKPLLNETALCAVAEDRNV